MKIPSLTVASVLFFNLAFVAFAANNGSGDNIRGAIDQENQRNLEAKPEKVKLIIKNEKGKEYAKNHSTKVSHESKRFKIVSIEVPPEEVNGLENNPDIEFIDLDIDLHAILPIEMEEDASKRESDKKNGGKNEKARKLGGEKRGGQKDQRKLAEGECPGESMPRGIKAVQADQVPPGPHASSIKVCVVDTGYDLGHVDLPGSDTVDGTRSKEYGQEWHIDGHGHGGCMMNCAQLFCTTHDEHLKLKCPSLLSMLVQARTALALSLR